jgi:hypothetical protein
LIETKSHRGKISERGEHLYRDGGLFEKDIIKQTLANIYDLRSMLAVHLDQPPWISATIVFTNALVPRVCRIKNIEVLHLSALESWMSKARGQMPADALWSQRDRLRKALS